MESINYLIVEIDDAYENDKKINDDLSIIVNTTIESVEHITRKAKVIEAPKHTVLKKDDLVIVHHNIFRLRYGIKGVVTRSNYHLKDNQYFVPLTEVFMYKRTDDWIPLDPYCFVKPIVKEIENNTDIIIPDNNKENSHKGMINNIGIMSYPNEGLKSYGIKKGDTIIFSKNSEYEFKIENELYYKMSTKDIMGTICKD